MKYVRIHLYRPPIHVFCWKVLYILINIVISRSYKKKPARIIKTLYQNRQYYILFYRYEWSFMKNIRIQLCRPPRLVFRYKFLYILINIVISWSYQKKPAQNIETLCRNRQYCILFNQNEWSWMKNVRINLYRPPKLIFVETF